MRDSKRILVVIILTMFALPLWSFKTTIDPEQRYLLLATTLTGTMQKELDEASGEGFRVLMGSPTSGSEMVLLLERTATPPNVYRYKLLATTRTGTMQKELNEEAREGYRLLPRTMIAKKGGMFGGDEVVLIMEKEPNSSKHYEYKLLATNLTGTMQKEILESMKNGFTIGGLVSRGEHMVIMEKVHDESK